MSVCVCVVFFGMQESIKQWEVGMCTFVCVCVCVFVCVCGNFWHARIYQAVGRRHVYICLCVYVCVCVCVWSFFGKEMRSSGSWACLHLFVCACIYMCVSVSVSVSVCVW